MGVRKYIIINCEKKKKIELVKTIDSRRIDELRQNVSADLRTFEDDEKVNQPAHEDLYRKIKNMKNRNFWLRLDYLRLNVN